MRLAIIPARGGSKRIPQKNIRIFRGKPMIAWSILAAKESGCFDEIIVSTDDENIDLLLQELEHVPDAHRGATFHCVACFVAPGETDGLVAKGTWRGHIAHERQGDGGFGYDPVFIDSELGIAAANLSADDKNSRSHRGKALAELVTLLQKR